MIRLVCINGWREKDIMELHDSKVNEDAVRVRPSKSRGRKKRAWEWSRSSAPSSPRRACLGRCARSMFATRKGGPMTVSAFQSAWRRTLERANRIMADQGRPPIENLHFHDLRAWAGDEADAQDRDVQKFLGHDDPRTTERHYQRREKKVRPLR